MALEFVRTFFEGGTGELSLGISWQGNIDGELSLAQFYIDKGYSIPNIPYALRSIPPVQIIKRLPIVMKFSNFFRPTLIRVDHMIIEIVNIEGTSYGVLGLELDDPYKFIKNKKDSISHLLIKKYFENREDGSILWLIAHLRNFWWLSLPFAGETLEKIKIMLATIDT